MSTTSFAKNRPDQDGTDRGLYRRNRSLLLKSATVCALCGKPIDKNIKWPDPWCGTADHIIPVSKGGRSTMDNLQPAHKCCNLAKSNKINVSTKEREIQEAVGNRNLPQYVDWSGAR